MCGIAGAIGNLNPERAEVIVRSMTGALQHRGPDDRGAQSWNLGNQTVAFGHTRLSILDLSSAGRQPMTDPSGSLWTIFNGEIYNFRELRKLTDASNLLFRTGTDTVVLFHAYHRWAQASF